MCSVCLLRGGGGAPWSGVRSGAKLESVGGEPGPVSGPSPPNLNGKIAFLYLGDKVGKSSDPPPTKIRK